MAATNFTTTLRTARMTAINTVIGAAGKLNLYNGVRPAGGGAATTLLAQFTLGATAGAAAAGVWTMTPPAAVNASASGTVTWARITTSAGTYVMDMDVTNNLGAGPLKLSNPILVSGKAVSVPLLTVTDGNP